jgi:beta-phosphoglucomutase-like phosphatase (HAD superfamily)
MTKTRAVVFDLFGTLVDNFSFRVHEEAVTEMASLLGLPRDDFSRWYGYRTGEMRLAGGFPTIEANTE